MLNNDWDSLFVNNPYEIQLIEPRKIIPRRIMSRMRRFDHLIRLLQTSPAASKYMQFSGYTSLDEDRI